MTKRTRWALIAAAIMGAGMMAGCPPAPSSLTTRPGAGVGGGILSDAPILGNEPVARGVYVALDRRTPLKDTALAKATMTRPQVLKAVAALHDAAREEDKQRAAGQPMADAVPGTAMAKEDDTRDAEPAPDAVKFYLRGRQRFLEGANSEALTALEKALQLDPKAFTVLRLMGRVSFANSQLARGATYLQRAWEMRPADVEVNYLLGRYWLERTDYDMAAYFFMQAEDSPEKQVTSVHTPLASFYLGISLQLGGYHLAAAKEHEHFLELCLKPVPGYRYDPELSYLMTMQWASHLAVAENFARIGDYHAALPHYQAAAAARPEDTFIGSRLVNALVHEKLIAPAQKAALSLLSATHGSEEGVKLVAWTYQAAGKQTELVHDLEARLANVKSSDAADAQAAVLTLAATHDYLGDKLEGARTLESYLRKHPRDLDVLGKLLKRADSAQAFDLALSATARAIAADPEHWLEVLRFYVPAADGAAGAAYVKAPPASKAGEEAFARDYLVALVRQSHNRPADEVDGAFSASLKGNETFFPAREAYVAFLLSQEKFDKATAVIDGVMKTNPDSSRAWKLQIDSEIAQQRLVHAVQLAQEARNKFPRDVDIRMELVSILRLRGQDAAADAETQLIIRDMPKYETAYRALVNSLFLRGRRNPASANTTLSTILTVLSKMNTELPDSRFGRISSAIVYANAGRYEDAVAILQTVLNVDPDEADALLPLAKIVSLTGRPSDGVMLLEAALKRKPQVEVVRSLASMYSEVDRRADALTMAQRFAQENPESEDYLMLYVAQLVAQSQRGEAVTQLTQAHARFPRSQNITVTLARMLADSDDHEGAIALLRDFMKTAGETTDRLYILSHFYSAAGNEDASVAALQRVLAIMPDHIGANNDLGYFWVNAGIHVDQAEPMIRKALDSKPDDPAFLDSLAWLYYKQGRFADAAALLEKALALPSGSSPEVVQHYGDTLYRLNRTIEAVDQWNKALQMLAISDRLSAADRKEQAYLTKAVTDTRAGKTPTISPIVDDKTKAAGPASTAPGNGPQ